VIYVNGSNKAVLGSVRHPTTSSISVRYKKSDRGTLYVRALLERGKTVLVKIPIG